QDSRTKLLDLDGRLKIRLVVTRCRMLGQSYEWRLRLYSPTDPDITLIARLAPGNEDYLDYFSIPRRAIRGLNLITLRPGGESIFGLYRFQDLAFLKRLGRRRRKSRAT